MDIQELMRQKAQAAKAASRQLAVVSTGVKDKALRLMAAAALPEPHSRIWPSP